MHRAAVFVLCGLAAYFVWRDVVELFVAWYSGACPPLTNAAAAWICARAAVALAAGATAVATL